MSRILNQPPTPFERYISDPNKEGSGLIALVSILAVLTGWDHYNRTNSLKLLDQETRLQLMHQAEPELKQAEPQLRDLKPPKNLEFFLEPPPRSILWEDLFNESIEEDPEIEQLLQDMIFEMNKRQQQKSPFI